MKFRKEIFINFYNNFWNYLIGLSEAVDSSNFAFLVRIGENAANRFSTSNRENEILPVFWSDILSKLSQEPWGPFLLDFGFFIKKLIFDSPFFFWRHSLFMFFEVFTLTRLEVKPNVGEALNVRQQGFDKGVKLVLKGTKWRGAIIVFANF